MTIEWLILALIFFAIALLYSMVGFGGGSSYIALLFIVGVSYAKIPALALLCNLVVVSGGVYHFYRQGHFNWRLVAPFVVFSVPLAYLGGSIPIEKETFSLIMGVCLSVGGLKLIFWSRENNKSKKEISRIPSPVLASFMGAGLGFLSGVVGIGGGIFLAPVMHLMGWGSSKQIAAVASSFIWLNSMGGLAGQMTKNEMTMISVLEFLPLIVAVFIGGQLGSRLGSGHKMPTRVIELSTGILVMFVAIRILH